MIWNNLVFPPLLPLKIKHKPNKSLNSSFYSYPIDSLN